MSLSNIRIQKAKPAAKPYKLYDLDGLFLLVRKSGAKLWRYKYRIGTKENQFAIGEFFDDKRPGHLSLEAARKARDEARELVRKGIHPAHARQQTIFAQIEHNKNTFKAIAIEWMARKSATSWNEETADQVRKVLEGDVFPHIGNLPILTVKAAQILEIIQRVDARGANTYAHLIRQWCSAIFRYAVATLRAEVDPAQALRGAIMRNKTKHSRALSKQELRDVLERLRTYRGEISTLYAIRLMTLTFVRTVELRQAKWPEFDLEAAEWRIPASRMKMKREHIVPLSRQAVRLLENLQKETGDREYLFPNRRRPKACMTSTTINRALERMGFLGEETIGFSGHGFRSTASTLLNEVGIRADVVEKQLAHEERNSSRRAYNRAEYLDERKVMMQTWADMVDQIMQPKLKVVR